MNSNNLPESEALTRINNLLNPILEEEESLGSSSLRNFA
jgi:hypothetical protein